MADNTEKPRYVSHLNDESYAAFLASPEAEAVRGFYKGFPDTIGIVKQAWRDAGYRWAEKNEPDAFLEMRCDNIREDFKGFPPSIVESQVNEFRRRQSNLVGYRADREPDASWYRPSSHRPPYISPEEAGYRSRASGNAGNYPHIFNPDVECREDDYIPQEEKELDRPDRNSDWKLMPDRSFYNVRTGKCRDARGREIPCK